MVKLSVPESDALLGLTIVGIGYSQGASSLYRASQVKEKLERFLFLIPDVANKHDANAVMIHDGKRKLGYVAASEAPRVRALFDRWRAEDGFDSVVVCDIGWMSDHSYAHLKRTNTAEVTGLARVHERAARKYAAKQSF
jgi:hypothetical protein